MSIEDNYTVNLHSVDQLINCLSTSQNEDEETNVPNSSPDSNYDYRRYNYKKEKKEEDSRFIQNSAALTSSGQLTQQHTQTFSSGSESTLEQKCNNIQSPFYLRRQ